MSVSRHSTLLLRFHALNEIKKDRHLWQCHETNEDHIRWKYKMGIFILKNPLIRWIFQDIILTTSSHGSTPTNEGNEQVFVSILYDLVSDYYAFSVIELTIMTIFFQALPMLLSCIVCVLLHKGQKWSYHEPYFFLFSYRPFFLFPSLPTIIMVSLYPLYGSKQSPYACLTGLALWYVILACPSKCSCCVFQTGCIFLVLHVGHCFN